MPRSMRSSRGARAGAILLALLAWACSDADGPTSPRSALLITLDTTRWDAVGACGGPEGVTPHLDRLAEESVTYQWARTVAPLTLPAHASMMTGLYPPRHRVRGNGPMVLPPAAMTLAERARYGGIQTAAFIAALALDRAFGIAQGFEVWDQPQGREDRWDGQISERPAREVVAAARDWLAARDRQRPYFLWVHLFDPHAPYAPPDAFLEQAGGDPYLGEVAVMDAEIGALLDDLRREGALDRTLVMVIGDHGEGLGEHGEDTHGAHCWDSTIRVPLILRHPDGLRAGEVSNEIVSAVDVFPTLLEALGLGEPGDVDGRSLYAPVPAGRGVYFESYHGWLAFGWSPLAGWADARAKYIHGGEPQLFDPSSDPREESDRFGGDQDAVLAQRSAIAAVAERAPVEAGLPATVGSEALEHMAALGYVTTDCVTTPMPHPLEASDRHAPRSRLAELAEYERAADLLRRGRAGEAIPVLEGVLAGNRFNAHARDRLAEALEAAGRTREAADALRERLRYPPERIGTHLALARCLLATGEEARAHEHELRAMELLVQVHERRGEADEAARYRRLLEQARGGAGGGG